MPSLMSSGWPDFRNRRHLSGAATVRRKRRWAFPAFELMQDGDSLAAMGRFGWFSIFFRSGQRIEFADGESWRIKSRGVAGNICPIVVDSTGRKVAVSGLGVGCYGINGEDYACVLAAAEARRLGRANRWVLRHFEDELAVVTQHPLSIEATHPVPLGAVLLSFVLVRYGIPGESAPRMPSLRWG